MQSHCIHPFAFSETLKFLASSKYRQQLRGTAGIFLLNGSKLVTCLPLRSHIFRKYSYAESAIAPIVSIEVFLASGENGRPDD